jgi:hypothetical protein
MSVTKLHKIAMFTMENLGLIVGDVFALRWVSHSLMILSYVVGCAYLLTFMIFSCHG